MSKELVERTQVYSFLQKSLENQNQQTHAMQVMLNRMVEVEESVMRESEKVAELAKQINDENRLLPSEIDELYNAVVAKSIELAKVRNEEGTDDFKKVVGKYRRLIWSKMKKRFGTSKYIHTKRVDFKPALDFVKHFNPEDYI